MTYISPGIRHRQDVRYGATSQVIYCWPEVDGVLQASVTSPVVTIYQPGTGDGSSSLISSGVCTQDETTSRLSYSLNCSDTSIWQLAEKYVAVFSFVKSGTTHYLRRQFDVVRIPLVQYPPCRADDLRGIHKAVDQAMSQIGLTNGANQETADRIIMPAWEEVLQYIATKGFRPALLCDAEDFAPMLRALASHRLCRFLSTTGNDLYDRLAAEYRTEYERLRGETTLTFSPSDSYSGDEVKGFSQPQFHIGPPIQAGTSGSIRGWRR